ncbi:MAG: [FeFe] hydrogenase H-cluster radical SAM maturase HydE [Bacteroidales bacterium]|nr:[FeFe] hydrogenase H-cluster radical SAM maturase HydE [Bacteroidales bacterium]
MLNDDTERLKEMVDAVRRTQDVTPEQLRALLDAPVGEAVEHLHAEARKVAQDAYGKVVFLRGLIELSSHCRNNCLYCGIRRDNVSLPRYRLNEETVLACCHRGYESGLRTFVLQGGEDPYFTDARLLPIVRRMRKEFPDCAITLSLGERSRESYQALFDAGANRYLLRHETADPSHYAYLHPAELSFEHRMQCLRFLREIGFQVGAGFMVGSPRQNVDTIYKDLQFVRSFRPEMFGIGPFVATKDTPFAHEPNGSVEVTLRLLSLVRLLHPHVLLPATTALGSLDPTGREKGILAGANVVMPNISPSEDRNLYRIYDGKLTGADDIRVYRNELRRRFEAIGYSLSDSRGDYQEPDQSYSLTTQPNIP